MKALKAAKPSWCERFPHVSVERGDPKPLTLIYPYYENPQFLRHQVGVWRSYPADLRRYLELVLVDDGSPKHPLGMSLGPVGDLDVRVFRIELDVRWNWIAARNIGFRHADTEWCLVTDMDHVVSTETLDACIHSKHDSGVIYGFSRQEHTGSSIAPHPNSWLMTKRMFWRVGGYDEALSGHYGTDGDWRRRCRAVAPIHILEDRLVRHEYQGDSSTTAYQRKQPQDAEVSRIIRRRGKGWKPKVLTFPYHEVLL